ncbi:hypothetical protein CYMTET_29170, partial [Cymbomonas tetramitiformis]
VSGRAVSRVSESPGQPVSESPVSASGFRVTGSPGLAKSPRVAEAAESSGAAGLRVVGFPGLRVYGPPGFWVSESPSLG